ncbi:hypothetical protein SAMN05443248_6611 [Bradyrhizobium erythrophlei]|uniref:Uncharacterized protein n=1 Tax=Bradyrhizobium erythrophlei TaxID=1437360 RepID=A0A1M5WK25_9BRAD|nr:hypothetical protein SAMN05443248_6611 [Bradyrhizobium erythrophlei]
MTDLREVRRPGVEHNTALPDCFVDPGFAIKQARLVPRTVFPRHTQANAVARNAARMPPISRYFTA